VKQQVLFGNEWIERAKREREERKKKTPGFGLYLPCKKKSEQKEEEKRGENDGHKN
jgi:hypothetical protein